MALDPTELMSPRDRLAYNINMRGRSGVPEGAPNGSHVAQKTDFFGADGLDFEDVLDIVNPLQHLPLVATAYRALTGDEISAGARVIGGGLYGGPAGVFTGAIDAAIAEANGGKDLGGIAIAKLTGEEIKSSPAPDAPEIAVASADVAAIEPASGGPSQETAHARDWVDPDSAEALSRKAAPSVREEALPFLPSDLEQAKPSASTGPAPDPKQLADSIPTLSEDQVSLLLSSVGLKPGQEVPAAPKPEANPDELAADRSLEALDLGQINSGAGQAVREERRAREFLPPMKQIYIRQPVGSKAWANQSFTPNFKPSESPEVNAGSGGGHSGDQAWVAEAMAAALDKYQKGGPKAASKTRGSTVDDAF